MVRMRLYLNGTYQQTLVQIDSRYVRSHRYSQAPSPSPSPATFFYFFAKFGSRPSFGSFVTSIHSDNDQSILLLAFRGVPWLNPDPRRNRCFHTNNGFFDPSSASRNFFRRATQFLSSSTPLYITHIYIYSFSLFQITAVIVELGRIVYE